MRKAFSIFLSVMAAHVLGAAGPSFELVASSTNLIVTEEAQVSLVLRLPPSSGGNAARWPFHPTQPPHIICSFLDSDWKDADTAFERTFVKSAKIVREEKNVGFMRSMSQVVRECSCPMPFAPEQMRNATEGEPSFTLNDEMTDGVIGIAILLSQGRRSLDFGSGGQERLSVPFKAKQEKDGSWLLTVSVAPWRAAKPGRVQLDAATVELPFVSSMQWRRDDYNRPIPVPSFTNVVLHTQLLTLTVIDPPKKGRPASWYGAISSGLTLSANLSTNVCTAGDRLTVTMDIGGVRNPSSIKPPDIAAALSGTTLTVDAGSAQTEIQEDGVRYVWNVTPRGPGIVEFPALPVSYYDLGRRDYVTRMTDPIPVQVEAGQQVVILENVPQPDGIDMDPRGAESRPLLPHLPLSIVLFLLPPILYLCIRLAPPVRRRIAASNAAYRKARAFGACRRALKSRNARRRAVAINTFFTVRYGVNGAAVTAADAQRLMAPDYSEEDIALIVMNLEAHDAQTYSAKPGVGTLAVLFAFGLCLGGSALAATDPARAAFAFQRASSLATQATEASDFKLAADAYRDCLDAGADNACLYQNLGACLVMAGDLRGARAAFGCVERRTGETPSTIRGLKAALAKQTNNPQAELPPTRFFLRPHVSWSVDTRLVIAAALWALLWLVALIPAGALRRFLLTAFFVAFCAAAVSVGVSLVEEHHAKEVLYAQD